MTDSMKFGPEWLRNMSTDSVNSVNNVCNNSNTVNAYSSTSHSTGSSGSGSNYHNNSNINTPTTTVTSTMLTLNHSSNVSHHGLSGNSSVIHTSGGSSAYQHIPQKNSFPEFRYGREEMLSLFDKHCCLPDVLPAYKKIFVEKVQYPLALVPSTDEEMMVQGPSIPSQRPSWPQRSPVGFSNSTRGTGRGGSVDRGRMRGKSIYHNIYQRPVAMFEDDIRSVSLKSERNWSERNGLSGDAHVNSGGSLAGGGPNSNAGNNDWNGTPTTSPRKEYSCHNRNLENWRRNRNDDGNGEPSINNGLSNNSTDGWRGVVGGSNNTNFGGNYRWSRSSSWRDEDISSGMNNDAYGSSNNYSIQRSYSTISTTVTERSSGSTGGYLGSGIIMLKNNTQSNNNFCSSINSSTSRTLNSNNAINRCSGNSGVGNNSQWSQSISSSADADDNLPEWAMENPSDGGGTFDATGAFHGSSLDDDDSNSLTSKSESVKEPQNKNISGPETSNKYTHNNANEYKNHKETDEHDNSQDIATKPVTVDEKTVNVQENTINNSYSTSPYEDVEKVTSRTATPLNENNNNSDLVNKTETIDKHNNEYVTNIISDSTITSISSSNVSTSDNHYDNEIGHVTTTIENTTTTTNISAYTPSQTDYSDRMKKVADDMVQKLIMDDDIATSELMLNKSDTSPLPINNSVNSMTDILSGTTNTFVSPTVNVLLKASIPTQSQSVSVMSVSPTLKIMPLYGGGIIMDHAAMQQHHHLNQHQQQISTGTSGMPSSAHHNLNNSNSITSASADLWFYRDPQSKVQGPFTAMEMTEWYRAGYFNENLYVRRVCDSRFRALGELIKLSHNNMPFTNLHLMSTVNTLGLMDGLPPSTLKAAPSTVQASTASNITTQSSPSSTTLPLKIQNEQSINEELKGNVTAAADSISAAVKNLINSVDMSQMLNVHFQMLQERYLEQQEMLISAELTKNECFQRLSLSERDEIIRQKVQLLRLPEYLTSLNALINSLATLNPRASIQLYDAIAAVQQQQPQQLHHQPQQHIAQESSVNVPFMVDQEELLLNAHQQQPSVPTQFPSTVPPPPSLVSYIGSDVVTGNAVSTNPTDLSNEYYLRMLLRGVGSNGSILSPTSTITTSAQSTLGISGNSDYLAETQMIPNSPHNPMMQMWLPHQQHLLQQDQPTRQIQTIQNAATQNSSHGQWAGGPLVGIPHVVMNNVAVGMQPPSLWDTPNNGITTGSETTEQQQKPQNQITENIVQQQQMQQQPTSTTNDIQFQQNRGLHTEIQNKENTLQLQNTDINVLANDNNSKQRKEESKPLIQTEKQTQQSNGNNNKRSNNKQQSNKQQANRDEYNSNNNINQRKDNDERARDATEDKRRQKEERRRQQAEEEKRRSQLAEEEKRRQIQEEKERQQQIQAQRRKVMMASNHSIPSNTVNMNNISSNSGNNKSIQQQRLQSSVAPWSIQPAAAVAGNNLGPPCLAEIQKAERRERRADQQRQMEMLERQMRSTTSPENIDTLLKWNASSVSVPVKSFAEIQAEEAKRLLTEQDIQKRKQHELLEQQQASGFMTGNANSSNAVIGHLNVAAVVAAGTANGNTNNLLAIWGSNSGGTNSKAWPPSFWEESVKFNSTNKSTSGISTAAVVIGSTGTNSKSVQPQQKMSSVIQSAGVVPAVHSRNLRKSQTVSVMQHANGGATAKNVNRNQQQNVAAVAKQQPTSKIQQSQKGNHDIDKKTNVTVSLTEKKTHNNINNNNNNSSTTSLMYQKRTEDLENEFTMWCTKSLSNMNTKVDVPTFVTFLQDLESPYEVKDYIRMYLGENKEFAEFSKQFLERRSKYKNLQRAQNAHNDDMCKPAPAITPSTCNDNSDNKGKQKKMKKNKMTKLDARILGFSVTAAEGRINVGDRDYADAS